MCIVVKEVASANDHIIAPGPESQKIDVSNALSAVVGEDGVDGNLSAAVGKDDICRATSAVVGQGVPANFMGSVAKEGASDEIGAEPHQIQKA